MTDWIEVANSLKSSYKEHNLGWVLYSLVMIERPRQVVEIGCYQGYSTIFLAAALKACGSGGYLAVYDLWESYEFTHTTQIQTRRNVSNALGECRISYHQLSASEVPHLYQPRSLDIVHIDISNHGLTYRWAMTYFAELIHKGGWLVMEGGSYERDQVDWMTKYNKPPIRPVVESESPQWEILVLNQFPSMTLMRRR